MHLLVLFGFMHITIYQTAFLLMQSYNYLPFQRIYTILH